MRNPPWTDQQNDMAVAEYFKMFAAQSAGRPLVKAEIENRLGNRLGRSGKSVSYKFQNVSAILHHIGEAWLTGYVPRHNYQHSLIDAMERWLGANDVPASDHPDDPALLELVCPPALRNMPPPAVPKGLSRLARKYDIALRNERNRKLGRAGERYVLAFEQQRLRKSPYAALADEVKWGADQILVNFDLSLPAFCSGWFPSGFSVML